MSKHFITYLLVLLVISSVSTAYINLSEEICKASIVIDSEKDCDESLKELEIKFLHSDDELHTYKNKISQIKLPYTNKVYNAIYQKQENPPPEIIV